MILHKRQLDGDHRSGIPHDLRPDDLYARAHADRIMPCQGEVREERLKRVLESLEWTEIFAEISQDLP